MRPAAAIAGLLVACAPVDFYFGNPDGGDHDGGPEMDAGAACGGCGDVIGLHCDVDAGACVQCLTNAHCTAPYDICDPTTHRCVECLVSADCGGGRACEPTTHHCGAKCTSVSECAAFPATNHCSQGGICGTCDDDGDCGTNMHCDTASGQCSECNDNSHCAQPTPICDRSREICVQCLTGADCPGKHLCDPATQQCVSG
jgi:Cys-rich repeat protein